MEQRSHWRNNSWEVLQTLMKPDQDNQNKTFHWYFPFTRLRNKANVQCKKSWLWLSYMQVAKTSTVTYLSQSNIHITMYWNIQWKKSNSQFSIWNNIWNWNKNWNWKAVMIYWRLKCRQQICFWNVLQKYLQSEMSEMQFIYREIVDSELLKLPS